MHLHWHYGQDFNWGGRMKNLLVYYGWMNSFNSAINQWTNEKVAQEMSKYNLIVLGDGIQLTDHGDYANSSIIISRIKQLNPNTLIFGYATVNQDYDNFCQKVSGWDDLEIDGIFMDEAGYDYGSVSTNGRKAFNDKVDLVHSQAFAHLCFVNSWKIEHVLGENSDVSYPDSTWNPNDLASNLANNDWYLLESFAVDSSGSYESKTNWFNRGEKCTSLKHLINLAALSCLDEGDADAQDKFDFIYTSACMWGVDAVGSSDYANSVSYGASNAKTKWWTRPDISKIVDPWNGASAVVADASDSDVYMGYFQNAKMEVDFSTGAETSSIENY